MRELARLYGLINFNLRELWWPVLFNESLTGNLLTDVDLNNMVVKKPNLIISVCFDRVEDNENSCYRGGGVCWLSCDQAYYRQHK